MSPTTTYVLVTVLSAAVSTVHGQVTGGPYTISPLDVNGGGEPAAAGAYALNSSTAQRGGIDGTDCDPPSTYGHQNGFWAVAFGVCEARIASAVSRKSCDLSLSLGGTVTTDSRQGGITQLRISFDRPPSGPGANPVSIQQKTCAAPSYVPYSGGAVVSPSIAGNELVLAFSPALENARTYRIDIGTSVTNAEDQWLEVRALVGDVNSDGQANAADRSAVVGVWTGGGSFSCATDVTGDGTTNAADRSAVVGAWTGSQNCAP